jgi:hypothetical protein
MRLCLMADTEQTIGTRMGIEITKSVTARGVGNEKKTETREENELGFDMPTWGLSRAASSSFVNNAINQWIGFLAHVLMS